MKKLLILTITLLVAHFVVSGALACDKQPAKHSECCKFVKNAKVEVTNVDNGVVIKITSDKPEVVKMIQEHGAKCKKECTHHEKYTHAKHKCPHSGKTTGSDTKVTENKEMKKSENKDSSSQ